MLFKPSMVVRTHIETFFISSEHKLLQKSKTVRKFGVQTFALIKLVGLWERNHVCILKRKAHDLLGTSLTARTPGSLTSFSSKLNLVPNLLIPNALRSL